MRKLLFPREGLERKTGKGNEVDEPSVMELFLESGKDSDPDSITARLLLLMAAAVRLPNSHPASRGTLK